MGDWKYIAIELTRECHIIKKNWRMQKKKMIYVLFYLIHISMLLYYNAIWSSELLFLSVSCYVKLLSQTKCSFTDIDFEMVPEYILYA